MESLRDKGLICMSKESSGVVSWTKTLSYFAIKYIKSLDGISFLPFKILDLMFFVHI